eukprot:208305_1
MTDIITIKDRTSTLIDRINTDDLSELTKMIKTGTDPNISLKCTFKELNGEINLPPLHYSAQKGNKMITSTLLESGANVNGTDEYGTTALHWAATNGNVDICELLIKYKANVNAKDVEGMTALHMAADSGKTSTVKFLIKMGADITIKSINNESALDLAVTKHRKNCIKTLKKSDKKRQKKRNKKHKRGSQTALIHGDDWSTPFSIEMEECDDNREHDRTSTIFIHQDGLTPLIREDEEYNEFP